MSTPELLRAGPCAETCTCALDVLVAGERSARTDLLIGGLRARACRVERVRPADLAAHLAACPRPDVVILIPGGDGPPPVAVLRHVERQRLPALVLGGQPGPLSERMAGWLCDASAADATADEVFGRASTLARMAAHGRRMGAKIRQLRRIGRHLRCNYEQIDNELLLAGQLQRDFLPKQLPAVEGLRFVTLMRPYSWVSGDMYDIFRIDEDHVGLYVMDAVGHGVAAGLLTMFIKQAIVPKRIENRSYRILSPAEVLHELNQSLTQHDLPNCQYVTICYALVNHRTRMVQVACAAHPAPMLLEPDGQVRAIECDAGCVIGVFARQPYRQTQFDLREGQRLILYSDGLEEAFGRGEGRRNRWLRILRRSAGRDLPAIFRRLQQILDRTRGSLHPQDDITAVGLEATTASPAPVGI